MDQQKRYRHFIILLKKLAKVEAKIIKKYGPSPEVIGAEMDTVCSLQEKILELFNLTPTSDNVQLLDEAISNRSTKPIVYSIYLLLESKGIKAKEDNYAPLELLLSNLLQEKDALDVLPVIGISTHIYQIYLYNILKADPSLIVDIYNEMIRAEPFLDDIGRMKLSYEELSKKNIRLLSSFLKSSD